MNPWEILGISPDSDKTQIKKSYARLVKQINRDESPEEFQSLREAFDAAMSGLDGDNPVPSSEFAEEKLFNLTHTDGDLEKAQETKSSDSEYGHQVVLEDLRNVLLSEDDSQWDEFSKRDELVAFDSKQKLALPVFSILIELSGKFFYQKSLRPKFATLASIFSWQEMEVELIRYYEPDDISRVFALSTKSKALSARKVIPSDPQFASPGEKEVSLPKSKSLFKTKGFWIGWFICYMLIKFLLSD